MNDSAVEMLTVAKDIFAKRIRVPKPSTLQVVSTLLCCGKIGAYAKLRKQTDRNLSRELDLVRLLRRLREYHGLFWALTTRS